MKNKLLAQNNGTPIGDIGQNGGFGTVTEILFGSGDPGANAVNAIARLLSLVIGFVTLVAGIYFMLQMFIGGLAWMRSSGDKTKLSEAQTRLQHALIGLMVVVAAYAITAIATELLGIDILLQDPEGLIGDLDLTE